MAKGLKENRLTSPVTARPELSAQKNPIASQNRLDGAGAKNLEQDFEELYKKLNDIIPGELEDAASRSEKQALHQKQNPDKSSSNKIVAKDLNFFERFLHDNWGMRTFFALGNEIAESTEPLLHTILPEPVAKLIYKVLWSLAIIATGSRVGVNATKSKDANKVKAGAKMLIHDGFSAIVAPTAVARICNWIQEKIYSTLRIPKIIGNSIKAGLSLTACYHAIKFLDPKAAEVSAWVTQTRNDRHKEINDALGAAAH